MDTKVFSLLITGVAVVTSAGIEPDTDSFPHSFYPRMLDSMPAGFPTLRSPLFDPFLDESDELGFQLQKDFKEFATQMHKMQTNLKRMRMLNGMGGTTIVKAPDKVLLRKSAMTYSCSGEVKYQPPFCDGRLIKFRTAQTKDFCYSDRYSVIENMLCLAHMGENDISFTDNNGRFACVEKGGGHGLIISFDDFKRMCNKLPWEDTYYYFPDYSSGMQVDPDRSLGCTGGRQDVCIFKGEMPTDNFS